MRHTLVVLGLIVMSLAAAGRAQAGTVEVGPVDATALQATDTALFGINRDTGLLSRYHFADGSAQRIDTVRSGAEDAALAIDAAAYIHGHENIVAFWTDPTDALARLLYVNTESARAAVVGRDLGAGRVGGAAAVRWQFNGASSAFDGVGAFQVMPHDDRYLLDNGTIQCWFNADEVIRTQGLVSKDSSGYDTGGHVHLYIKDARVKVRLQSAEVSYWVQSTGTIEPDRWYHVAFVFGVDGMKLFLNGIESGAHAYTGGLGRSSGGMGNYEPIVIGASAVQSGNEQADNLLDYFSGRISDVTIGGRALSAAEVAERCDAGTGWSVFAVQQIGELDTTIEFELQGDTVVPSEPFALKMSVLGAAINYGGAYDLPVTARLKVGGETFNPFGSFDKAVTGNVNDNQNPREVVFPALFAANTRVDLMGRSWIKKDAWVSGKQNKDWIAHRTIDSSPGDSAYVYALRNGDPLPDVQALRSGETLAGFVRDFIDLQTNTIVLDENEILCLFELGTSDLASSAADLEDLAVLLTLAPSPLDLQDDTGDGGSIAVRYEVERTGSRVRYQDAPIGLGLNGEVQTDRFVVQVSGGDSSVSVTTKAGVPEATEVLSDVGDEVTDALGFTTRLVSVEGDTYTLTVTSVSAASALSHLDFDFGTGSTVLDPDTAYDAVRNGEQDALVATGPRSRLLQVDHRTGGYEQIMTLNNVYEGLASQDGRVFYAISGQDLYRLDPAQQTEVLVKSGLDPDITELEFVGEVLVGFESANDKLLTIDHETGSQLGPPLDVNMTDIGALVIMPLSRDPALMPESFD